MGEGERERERQELEFGYVYVEPGEVDSIRRLGYLSVSEQARHGLVTDADLELKYGPQHRRALRTYDDCPTDIRDYLTWRCQDEGGGDGQCAVYFLYGPIVDRRTFAFVRGKTLLQLRLPRGVPVVTVPASTTEESLWFSRIEHAYVLAGKIKPGDISVFAHGRFVA